LKQGEGQARRFGSSEIQSHEPTNGNIVTGVFTPVPAKHTKSFNLVGFAAGASTKILFWIPRPHGLQC